MLLFKDIEIPLAMEVSGTINGEPVKGCLLELGKVFIDMDIAVKITEDGRLTVMEIDNPLVAVDPNAEPIWKEARVERY